MPGIVILDTGCYKSLLPSSVRARFQSNLRMADWEVFPSTVNALEIIQLADAQFRNDLLAVLVELRGNKPLLPWPTDILAPAAEAIAASQRQFKVSGTTLDNVIASPKYITRNDVEKISAFLAEREQVFDDLHTEARRIVRVFLAKHGMKDHWATATEFLDQMWMQPEHLSEYIEESWKQFALPGVPMIDEILQSEPWRFYFEIQGIAAYERVILGQQPKRAHFNDLAQLIYMGVRHRRMLVTRDLSLSRAANAVLRGRYEQARVINIQDLLS